jgi:pilus assembly protein Flp/PilA
MNALNVRGLVDFLTDEDGPTAVEYAVMLALIIVTCLIAIAALGTSTSATYDELGEKIAAAGS